MQCFCIISHQPSPLERMFCDIQIVIITNFIVVLSVYINRVDCSLKSLKGVTLKGIANNKYKWLWWVIIKSGRRFSNYYITSLLLVSLNDFDENLPSKFWQQRLYKTNQPLCKLFLTARYNKWNETRRHCLPTVTTPTLPTLTVRQLLTKLDIRRLFSFKQLNMIQYNCSC